MTWAAIGAAGVTTAGGLLGGLFGRKSSASGNEQGNTFNPYLNSYTGGLQQTAPWEFASLDPTATLAAMGGGSMFGGKDLSGYTATLQNMSDQEKKQVQFGNDALDRIKQRQESGQFLTPQETDFINQSLDKAFQYSHDTGMQDLSKMAASLAGGRGLRMSDSPVSQPMMQQTQNFETGLASQRAQLGMNATLNFSAQQNAFDEGIRQFQENLTQNQWATRQQMVFGGGMQGINAIGNRTSSTGTGTQTPSIAQGLAGGLALGGQLGNVANGLISGYNSTPATSGLNLTSSFGTQPLATDMSTTRMLGNTSPNSGNPYSLNVGSFP